MTVKRADRATAAGAVLFLTVGLLGCSSSHDADAVRSSATGDAQPSKHLKPSSTPMIDGIVVPEGARLAGAVFVEGDDFAQRDPGSTALIEPTPDSVYPWEALLTIEGDPFRVWDDLAGQISDAYHVDMPGSADSCVWTLADDRPRAEDGETTVEEQAEEARSQVIALAPPPPHTVGIDCHASAGRRENGRTRRFTLSMTGEDDKKPLTIHAESRWFPGSTGNVVPTAWAVTMAGPPDAGTTTPVPGPDPMPAGRAELLPTFPEQERAGPGEAFGTDVNCFETNASRMRVPDGGKFVASSDFGDLAVVAVDDVDAALEDFRLQVEGATNDPASATDRWRERIPSGETIIHYGHGVSAGGGYCGFNSSPDGNYLIVTLHAD